MCILDIDECSENNDNCSQNFSNTIGSYQCSCNDGYTLDSDQHNCNGNILYNYINHETLTVHMHIIILLRGLIVQVPST